MNNKLSSIFFGFGVFSLMLAPFVFGADDTISFNESDRVIVFAPHPDDEAIGTAGVIQRAIKAKAKVKVVCFTNGDNNELAFIVYEKRLTFKKKEFIHMGEVRRSETINAMKSLGLKDNDLVFLGYPDFGTMQIFTRYWDSPRPFQSMLTRVSFVPYVNCMSPQAPYVGESILKDLKTILLDFKPTKVFVSSPVDTNGDHRALYLFLRVALWDIDGKMSEVKIFPYLIHNSGWPMPRGYHPELELAPPRNLSGSEIIWQSFKLEDNEIETKNKTIAFYKSQIKYSPKYLFTFARKNELFGDYPIIALRNEGSTEHHWFDILNSPPAPEVLEAKNNEVKALSYEQKENTLFIKFLLGKKIDKDFWSSIFVFGYKRSEDFAAMPKLKIDVTVDGLRIRDKTKLLSSDDIKMVYDKESIVVSVSAFAIGNPDYILSCVRVNTKDVPYSDTAWRIIELE